MPVITLEWKGTGKDREQVVVTDPSFIKIKQDTAKFICERLGKNEGYTTKQEFQHIGAIDLITGNRALDELFEEEE